MTGATGYKYEGQQLWIHSRLPNVHELLLFIFLNLTNFSQSNFQRGIKLRTIFIYQRRTMESRAATPSLHVSESNRTGPFGYCKTCFGCEISVYCPLNSIRTHKVCNDADAPNAAFELSQIDQIIASRVKR